MKNKKINHLLRKNKRILHMWTWKNLRRLENSIQGSQNWVWDEGCRVPDSSMRPVSGMSLSYILIYVGLFPSIPFLTFKATSVA